MTETEMEWLTTHRPVELRASNGNSRSIGGYAAVFNRQSENLGGFVERVAPSFFNDSRADGWPGVIARYNHDDAFLLGATRNGTLQLSIDGIGLNYVVSLPESRDDILELVSRGDIGSSSFAFQVTQDDWGLTERNLPLRSLVSGRLMDVAPVSRPAYRDTSVGLRSLAAHKDVPVEDVIALSAQHELRKLFIRTDRPSERRGWRGRRRGRSTGALSGATAKAHIMAKAPLSGAGAKVQTMAKVSEPISGGVARVRTLAKKHPRQLAV
jgi:HK97 family phage prohead protease